jgi:hypothetical protein
VGLALANNRLATGLVSVLFGIFTLMALTGH